MADPFAKPLAAAIRAELDQTEGWWFGLFHQLLDAVGAESIVGDTIEVTSWKGDTVMVWEDKGFVDCPCRNCRRICS